jgi:hypothetical protein
MLLDVIDPAGRDIVALLRRRRWSRAPGLSTPSLGHLDSARKAASRQYAT